MPALPLALALSLAVQVTPPASSPADAADAALPAAPAGVAGAATAEPAIASEETALARARGRMANAQLLGAVVLGGLAAAQTGHVVFAWGHTDAYFRFVLGDDPGPPIDPTLFVTPISAPITAAYAGVGFIRAAATHRGVPPTVPAAYWFGFVPAAVGAGAVFGQFGESSSRDRLVVLGTVTSVLWFAGTTAVALARLPEERRQAKGSVGPTPFAVVPLLEPSRRGVVGGLVVQGGF